MYLVACVRPSAMPSSPRPAANKANNWIRASRMLVVMACVCTLTYEVRNQKVSSSGNAFVASFGRSLRVPGFAIKIHADVKDVKGW